MRRRSAAIAAAALILLARGALAGSTEPELAIADVTASVDDGVVTLQVVANYDYDNAMRLGYPVAVVVTQGEKRADLFLDGRVTTPTGGGSGLPAPGAPGVVAIAPTRISAVLPPTLAGAGAATVRLEGTFDGDTLRSNAVEVRW